MHGERTARPDRPAARDVEIRGTLVRRGDKVTIWEMSANPDEARFAQPFRFDVGREPNDHLGFGLGSPFCLGANLARLEIRVMFEELLDHFAGFESVGPLEWTNNNRLVGLIRTPVRAARETPRANASARKESSG